MQCPACARPLAVARPTCLYCGAPLPAEAVARVEAARRASNAAAAAPDGAAPGLRLTLEAALGPTRDDARPARAIVVAEMTRADPAALGRALGLAAYDAGQRVRRGGWQLLRVGSAPSADEAAALAAAGARLEVLSGDDVRAAERPFVALGGSLSGGRLELRCAEARVTLAAGDLLLVVRGPIARRAHGQERVTRLRPFAAHPEPGLCVHLHRRGDPRPLELHPQTFEFGPGGAPAGAAVVALRRWIEALAAGAPIDEGFRHVTPALGPAQPEAHPAAVAIDALRGARRGAREARGGLDNLAQFRFYSAWRATVERRVEGG